MNMRVDNPPFNQDLIPPCNPEAEVQVIGSLLLAPGKLDEIGSILRAGDFHGHFNEMIYRHLLGMSESEGRVDVPLLMDRMRQAGEWNNEMAAHVAEVVRSVAVAAHVKYHAGIVLRTSRNRQLINIGQNLVHAAWQRDAEPEACLSDAEEAMAQIRTGSYDTDPRPISEVMVEVMQEIDDIIHKRKTAGCMTGLVEFDQEVGGLFRGELTIVAARPGQGKTSLALQIAAYCAATGRTIYFATLEMPRIDLAMKRLCSVSDVSSQRVRTGDIDIEQQQQLVKGSQAAAQTNLHLHDWPEIRPFDIRRAARRVGAEVVFVDYLQYVTPPDTTKKRYEQVGDISRQLKTIARQMDVPVVACAQIGRQADQTKEAKPKLSHLRESGNIENDADVVLLLWRPEGGIVGKKGTYEGDRWDAELEVAKNRKGATTRLRLDWDGPRTVFACHGVGWEPPTNYAEEFAEFGNERR